MKAVLIVVLLLFSQQAWSQATNLVGIGIGIASVALRDQGMSPLMYTGLGYSGAVAFERHTASRSKRFIVQYHHAAVNNRYGNSCGYGGFAFKNQTLYHRDSGRHNPIVLGWSNSNQFMYYDNSGYANFSERSNYMTTFGMVAAYYKPFFLFGKHFVFELPADLKLVGFYLRPSYVSNSPEGYLDPANSGFMAWLYSVDAFLPHNAWNFELYPELSYLLKSGNQVSIGYHYEFVRMNKPEPVIQSTGAWYIKLSAKL